MQCKVVTSSPYLTLGSMILYREKYIIERFVLAYLLYKVQYCYQKL